MATGCSYTHSLSSRSDESAPARENLLVWCSLQSGSFHSQYLEVVPRIVLVALPVADAALGDVARRHLSQRRRLRLLLLHGGAPPAADTAAEVVPPEAVARGGRRRLRSARTAAGATGREAAAESAATAGKAVGSGAKPPLAAPAKPLAQAAAAGASSQGSSHGTNACAAGPLARSCCCCWLWGLPLLEAPAWGLVAALLPPDAEWPFPTCRCPSRPLNSSSSQVFGSGSALLPVPFSAGVAAAGSGSCASGAVGASAGMPAAAWRPGQEGGAAALGGQGGGGGGGGGSLCWEGAGSGRPAAAGAVPADDRSCSDQPGGGRCG